MVISKEIPTFSICSLDAAKFPSNDLAFYNLSDFLKANKGLVFPHRHSFYQVLYITKGGGTHIIDFKAHPVEKGIMFFLAPGQIHEWIFDNETDGVLINFSESFFSSFLANRHYTGDFTFFIGNGNHSVVDAKDDDAFITGVLNNISSEYNHQEPSRFDVIRVLLLHLFIVLNRKITDRSTPQSGQNYQAQIKNFELKIEGFYLTKRLPKEYAAMLYITPNHLNAICKQFKGIPAGRLIRDRVLLEAKRLLVNSDKNISEISTVLNFENNSYFSRFFKQYEGISPEEFKKNNKQTPFSVKSVIDSVKQ
jgi:AraC family transcriptional regulator, transcriptional activator of pobA